ncbi:unnamed protein product [Cylindrotheca closterium]|uniref:Uncharacterized protein n=1 Tax=Cylindrotheca closterium TaxID=2856 RepID=A0AAD2FN33_9STRA|nr:unnamed protein product [Cylindrotheca closterium]
MGRPTALSLTALLSPTTNNNNKYTTRPSYYWVELPASSFGIEYEMNKPITSRLSPSPSIGEHQQEQYQEQHHSPAKIFCFDHIIKSPRSSSNCSSNKTSKMMLTSKMLAKRKRRRRKAPFEVMMKQLNLVTSRFPQETAILYIREILEPSDPEFVELAAPIVRASQLKESQVQRLRVMLLPHRREEILVSCLDHYKENSKTSSFVISLERSLAPVLQHFAGFQRRYATCSSLDERFDLLFGFSYAIHRYSAWMHQYERKRSREKILSALARHWRHLLMKNDAEDLGLDREFSYPAVFCFLDRLKQQIENIDMQGLPPLNFAFETDDSPRPILNDESRVSLEDDSVSLSTMTTSTTASF